MKEIRSNILHFSVYISITLLFAAFQTALWPFPQSQIPAPPLWLVVLTYWAVYQSTRGAILMVYVLPVSLSFMTSMHMGLFIACCFILFLLLRGIKKRVFTNSSSYFILICSLSSIAFSIISSLASYLVESKALSFSNSLTQLSQALLLMFFTPFIFTLFKLIDRLKYTDDFNTRTEFLL